MTTSSRLADIRKQIAGAKLDAAIFFDEYSVRFLTGFVSSNALFVVTPAKGFFFTDGRYLAAAREFFATTAVSVEEIPQTKDWQRFFRQNGIRSAGVSMERIFADRLEKWRTDFGIAFVDFSHAENVIRAHKSATDLKKLVAVAKLADKALLQTLPLLREGITETEFAWELEKAGRELGAEGVSFPPIVAFGEHSALPHHRPTKRILYQREAILIDWGFVKDGWCSDCTRCFFFGQPTTAWLKAYERVLAAQTAGMAEIRIGKPCSAPHIAATTSLGEAMIHSFGHGVGLEVHEYPALSHKSTAHFTNNMVVTAEPGLYFPGRFGIRIEDTVVVTADGARSITGLPKDITGAILKRES